MMAATTERLLDHLPRFFRLDSAPVLALRIQYAGGMTWEVADRTLTIRSSTSAVVGTWDLSSHTITTLGSAVALAGCTVLYQSDAIGHLQADVLLDGAGDQATSNGDHLYAYASLTWALLDAYAVEVEAADASIAEALKDAYLHSATGDFLDLWGDSMGTPRFGLRQLQPFHWSATATWANPARKWGFGIAPLTDDVFAQMIVRNTVRPRNSPLAIAEAAFEMAGVSCLIREPWQDVARFDWSNSDDHWRTYDAQFWSWNVISPIWLNGPELADLPGAMAAIQRNRPIGTIVVHPGETPPTEVGAWGGGVAVATLTVS